MPSPPTNRLTLELVIQEALTLLTRPNIKQPRPEHSSTAKPENRPRTDALKEAGAHALEAMRKRIDRAIKLGEDRRLWYPLLEEFETQIKLIPQDLWGWRRGYLDAEIDKYYDTEWDAIQNAVVSEVLREAFMNYRHK